MPASFGYSRPGNNSLLVKPPAEWRDILLAPGAFDWLAALLGSCRASPESTLAMAARHLLVCRLGQQTLYSTCGGIGEEWPPSHAWCTTGSSLAASPAEARMGSCRQCMPAPPVRPLVSLKGP